MYTRVRGRTGVYYTTEGVYEFVLLQISGRQKLVYQGTATPRQISPRKPRRLEDFDPVDSVWTGNAISVC